MVPSPTWSQGNAPTAAQIAKTTPEARRRSRSSYNQRMADVQAAAEAKSKEIALQKEAQVVEAQKAAEAQKQQEQIKQQTAFQKYKEEVKQRGFVTTSSRYVADFVVGGLTKKDIAVKQVTTFAQSKGVPTINPIATARETTERLVLGEGKAKMLEESRKEVKKQVIRTSIEAAPTFIPVAGPLIIAGEQVFTKGGKAELKGTQESLQGLGVPEGLSVGLSYAPSVALAGVGVFQGSRLVSKAITKSQIVRAETDFIAQVKPTGDISKVGYYAETKVGPRVIKTGGVSEVKEVTDKFSISRGKSFSSFPKNKNINIGTKDLSLGVTGKVGEVGKVEAIWANKAPTLTNDFATAKVLTSAGEGTGTRVFTKTVAGVKIDKQAGILFRQTPLSVPRNPRITDIAGVTKPTRIENIFSYKGIQSGSKLKEPSIRGFIEVLPETIEETSGSLVGITRQVPKISLPKLESVTKQVVSEARSVAIAKVEIPKVPKLVSPVVSNRVETKVQPLPQLQAVKQDLKQYQVPITITRVSSATKQESYSGSSSRQLPRVIQETRQEPVQQIEQQTGQQTKQAQRQGLQFRYPQQQRQQFSFALPSITPKTETIPFTFKLPKAQPFKLPRGSYGVEVRRGGKFYNVGTTKTLNQAIGLGKTKVSKTLAATYRIKGAKGLPLPTQKGFYSKTSKKEGLVFVEKRKFRLSKLGEKLEIQSAKRRKKKR